jgi:hypothetical protein
MSLYFTPPKNGGYLRAQIKNKADYSKSFSEKRARFMGKSKANVHQLKETVFVIIGDDGATNFGIIKGTDGAVVLIDADIRRMDDDRRRFGNHWLPQSALSGQHARKLRSQLC